MAGIKVQPGVVAEVGAEFSKKATELTGAVTTFLAAAPVPGDAIGWMGPGQDAVKAYNDLLAHVTEHLHNLEKAVGQTGSNLHATADAYQKMEDANTLPGH
ncbi:MAG: hypothetical protein DLM59_03075 [Pseudonocardiales bacterium]|nr:MAG: hypothetical protein DLM59_03075 [Pseudonocardiales bacterium]